MGRNVPELDSGDVGPDEQDSSVFENCSLYLKSVVLGFSYVCITFSAINLLTYGIEALFNHEFVSKQKLKTNVVTLIICLLYLAIGRMYCEVDSENPVPAEIEILSGIEDVELITVVFIGSSPDDSDESITVADAVSNE